MNGILLINKPLGYTSRDVVNEVCRVLNTKKVGHTGTLDPLASGVLVICVGKGLKMCELLTNHDKEYIVGVTLGISTDTIDLDGNIIDKKIVDISENNIKNGVFSFVGKYLQEVPKYSAVKIDGRKLYEYARSGIDVKLPTREVDIKSIDIISDIIYDCGLIHFNLRCTVSKGTYIRSLVRDIGKKLSVPAVMNSLIRIRLGDYSIDKCYSIDNIINNQFKLIDIMDAFSYIPRINVNNDIAFKVKNGVVIKNFFDDELAFIIDDNGNLLALYKNYDGICRPYKVFV